MTLKTPSNTALDRDLTRARYHRVRQFTEDLCKPLAIEDYVVQSMPDASPAKWHLAHTSWFFETFLLKKHDLAYEPLNPSYAFLFNSYYNSAGKMHARPKRGLLTRPTVEETIEYRRFVDDAMDRLLDAAPDALWEDIAPVMVLGINHEQQHQELFLTDIKHALSENPLKPVYKPASRTPSNEVDEIEWTEYEADTHSIGHDGIGFAFDNESPRHREFLEPFAIGNRLVTNGEYIEFMEDGGYDSPLIWLSDGWATAQNEGWAAPLYWELRDGDWWHFTLAGMRPINAAEPVCHVSYYEADAYASWAGARLPTEGQWEVASESVDIEGNFADSHHFYPVTTNADGADTPVQLFGDVWEWTRSGYLPYHGYHPAPGALGEYNGKFMSGQMVLRGGSCATTKDHMRRTYRNFFRPHHRWQFMGIRLVKDL